MDTYRILVINPGSTSTKIGVFENDTPVFTKTVNHEAKKLDEFATISDQLMYRKETIDQALKEEGIDVKSIQLFSGRGGGLMSLEGGTYEVNEKLLADATIGIPGQHPAQLGSQLAKIYADEAGGRAFIVNSPDTDEMQEIARVTGLKDVFREGHIHTLNQKEVAIRYADANGKKYEDLNLVICHIGGGISVTAHRQGRMVDTFDIITGDGPMTPTRAGQLPSIPVVKMCYSGKYSLDEMKTRINKTGGLIDHLGTNDGREVEKRIEEGDKHAKLIYDAMIYQIAKLVGSLAVVLCGKVDGIILTGGMSHSKYLTGELQRQVGWIAPVTVMAGEFELEALAAGALRVATGKEQSKVYTGIPVWDGFTTLK